MGDAGEGDAAATRAAAEAGDADAQHALAVMYKKGEGVSQSGEASIRWHLAAAEQGHPDSAFVLFVVFHQGLDGREADREQATRWLRVAAENGDRVAQLTLAMDLIADDENLGEAVMWLRKAAAQGSEEALLLLAALEP